MKKTVYALMVLMGVVAYGAMTIQMSRATICVGGGALAITAVPTVEPFGSITSKAEDSFVNHVFTTSIEFEDMRGVEGGFSLYVTATDFELNDGNPPSAKNTIDVTNLKMASDGNDAVGLVDCDTTTGITVSELITSAFIDSDDNGVSDSKALFVGDNPARIGKYSFEPEIDLTIPAFVHLGSYKTTLTFTII
jgi:hypothetical protein